MWYSYYGGYSDTIYNFNAGKYGDVLYIPNGATASSYGNKLYLYNDGVFTVNTDFTYTRTFRYSYDGVNSYNLNIVDSASEYNTILALDSDNVDVYYGNGLTTLSISGYNDRDVRLDDFSLSKVYMGIKDINTLYYSGNSILWGNNLNNNIKGGSGNDNIWGGWEGNDTLTGNEGADTFLYNYNGGHDVITDAGSADTIWLFNINLSDGIYYNYDNQNNVMHLYIGNGELEVNCSTGDAYYPMSYPVYQLADGTRLTYTGQWNFISWDADGSTEESISPLWGEKDFNNEIYGDSESEAFIYNSGDGNVNVFDAGTNDVFFLKGIGLEEILSAEITDSGVNLQFNDSGSLNVEGKAETFYLSGQTYHADYQNKTWTQTA